jgi:type II secretory pathway pseudopilin PulG
MRFSPLFPAAHRGRFAFSLVELLSVIAILSTLTALAVQMAASPAHQGFTRNVHQLADLVTQAQTYARSHNTHVWFGLEERSISGGVEVVVAARAARSGLESDLVSGNTEPIMRPLALSSVAFTTDYANVPGVEADHTDIGSSQFAFDQSMPGSSGTIRFTKVLHFAPGGEARLRNNELSRWIVVGLATKAGDGANRAAIQLSGLNGRAVVLRP